MRASTRRWSRWNLIPLTVLLLAGASAAPARAGKPDACPHARYETTDGAVLELGAVAGLDGVCDAVAPKLWKARRNGITVVAAKWKQCAGSKGTVRLAGKLIDGCRRFRGTLAIGKSLRSIDATRIECGERCATASASNTVVGEVAGGQALIALVRDADGVTAYTCGIGTNLPTRTGWFFGASTGDALPTLTSAGNGHSSSSTTARTAPPSTARRRSGRGTACTTTRSPRSTTTACSTRTTWRCGSPTTS